MRDNAGWMLVLAERMLNDAAMAEDVVQEALISAINGLDRFEERSSLKTWLHRITVNAALSKLRKQKRLAEQPIDEFLPEFDQYDCRIEQPWTHLASAQDIAEDVEEAAVQEHRHYGGDEHVLAVEHRCSTIVATREVVDLRCAQGFAGRDLTGNGGMLVGKLDGGGLARLWLPQEVDEQVDRDEPDRDDRCDPGRVDVPDGEQCTFLSQRAGIMRSMNDTPVADSHGADLTSAIDRLAEVDPADAADQAEAIAQRLAAELDPPTDGAIETSPGTADT